MGQWKTLLVTTVFHLLSFFGGAMFVFGAFDDAPGAQLIGCILLAVGIYISIKKI